MEFECCLPRMVFGRGRLEEVGERAAVLGQRAFVALDPFLASEGLGDRIASLLDRHGLRALICTDIEPNPSCFVVDAAADFAREHQCDVVVAVGGGSALDFGKGVAVVACNQGQCWQFTERSDHDLLRPRKALPIVAVPTTAGTGSEATPFAVFNNPARREKSTLVNDLIFPSLAIVDPELTATMPPALTAATGFDAFAHALEACVSRHATPFATLAGLEAIRLLAGNLRQAAADGSDLSAREQVAWAATLAGGALGKVGVALPHALGQPVSGYLGAAHGPSVAACMVRILKDSYASAPDSFAAVAEALSPAENGASTLDRAARCPALVQALLDDLNLHVRFADFGMTEADIEAVTRIALTGYYFDIQCHPKPVTEADIRALYRDCL